MDKTFKKFQSIINGLRYLIVKKYYVYLSLTTRMTLILPSFLCTVLVIHRSFVLIFAQDVQFIGIHLTVNYKWRLIVFRPFPEWLSKILGHSYWVPYLIIVTKKLHDFCSGGNSIRKLNSLANLVVLLSLQKGWFMVQPGEKVGGLLDRGVWHGGGGTKSKTKRENVHKNKIVVSVVKG